MRMMETLEWAEIFESVTLVAEMLRSGSHFGAMDFATRDRYRHAIEDLARRSRRSELDITRQAIARAKRAAGAASRSGAPSGDRVGDPGYYLISKRRPPFEGALGSRVPVTRRLLRAYVSSA